eukprot:4504476-Amphidinium_carterae.1
MKSQSPRKQPDFRSGARCAESNLVMKLESSRKIHIQPRACKGSNSKLLAFRQQQGTARPSRSTPVCLRSEVMTIATKSLIVYFRKALLVVCNVLGQKDIDKALVLVQMVKTGRTRQGY